MYFSEIHGSHSLTATVQTFDDLIGYDALLQLKLANRVSQSSNELKLNHLKQ